METHLHIRFSGSVQKVGFRSATNLKARELALRGWTKNLPDGKVELAVWGEEKNINTLLSHLESRFDIQEKEKLPALNESHGEFYIDR